MPTDPFAIECAPVLRHGSKITICGEAPGAQEVATFRRNGTPGTPFVGGSGKMLDRILASAGTTRDEVNLTNVVKRQPPNNDFSGFYTDAKQREPTPELKIWHEMLRLELLENPPNVVVAAGGQAMKALTGIDGITKYRGSILESTLVPGLKVIPMLHPAWVMRDNWKYFYICQLDMKKAVKESTTAHLRYEPMDLIIAPTLDAVIKTLQFIAQNPTREWCIDIETRGDTLACFAIAIAELDHRVSRAICVPVQDTTGPHWTAQEESFIWRALAEAMAANGALTNQNIPYDLTYLIEDYGCEPSGLWMDTMLAVRLLFPEFPRGLDFITSVFTDIIYYKDEGKTWGSKTPDQQLWTYCCKDVIATLRSAFQLESMLRQRGMWQFYLERLHRRLGWAVEMHGARLYRLDNNYAKMRDLLEQEIVKAQHQVNELAGYFLNVKSSQQVAHRLYDELGLPTQTKRRGKGQFAKKSVTTDEDTIRKLRMLHPNVQDLNAIILCRHLRTRQSNYFSSVSFDVDGYLPYAMHPEGTDTLRWTGGPSNKWRGGPSPQTIPYVIRWCYGPPPGRAFIQVDQSQSQARMVAWLSDCKVLKEIFSDPKRSVHKEMTYQLYGIPVDEVIKGSPQYDRAKAMGHAINYRMSPQTLSIKVGIPLHEAEEKKAIYLSDKQEIPLWHERIKTEVLRNGRLKNPFGYERWFYQMLSQVTNGGYVGEHEWTEACVFIPQSTDALITDDCIEKVLDTLPEVRIHQHGHDSALFSVPDDAICIRECAKLAKEAMEATIFIGGDMLTIPAEASYGYNWYSMAPFIEGAPTDRAAWEQWVNQRDKDGNTRESPQELVKLLHGIY